MAGIGFELKRLFRRKGLFATMRAYGYAGIVCTGPMLLGVLLQVGILVLCGLWGVGRANQDLLVCMVTYTLLASLTLTSFFSMPVTRFLADMLFAEREEEVLPSFWGSNAIMLVWARCSTASFCCSRALRLCRRCCACGCSTL